MQAPAGNTPNRQRVAGSVSEGLCSAFVLHGVDSTAVVMQHLMCEDGCAACQSSLFGTVHNVCTWNRAHLSGLRSRQW